MTDNGKKSYELIKVTLIDGSMQIDFNHDVNISLISHALRIASLELDNQIIASQQPKLVQPSTSIPIVGQDILDRIRRQE